MKIPKNIPDYGPYHGYPTRPMGGSNPYYCCKACGMTDPQINGTLSGHAEHCSWAQAKLNELELASLTSRDSQ